MAAGGKRFEYVPALNARQSHARALADIIARHCAGWTCFDLAEFSACRETTSERRKALDLAAR